MPRKPQTKEQMIVRYYAGVDKIERQLQKLKQDHLVLHSLYKDLLKQSSISDDQRRKWNRNVEQCLTSRSLPLQNADRQQVRLYGGSLIFMPRLAKDEASAMSTQIEHIVLILHV